MPPLRATIEIDTHKVTAETILGTCTVCQAELLGMVIVLLSVNRTSAFALE